MKLQIDNFKCTQCGTCCRWPGYVRLTGKEVDAIAEFIDMDVNKFIDTYTYLTHDRHNLSLIEAEGGSCIFLTDEGCAINEVKPQQCIDFPFKWNFKGWENKCGWGIQEQERLAGTSTDEKEE